MQEKPTRRLTPAQQLYADLIIAGGKPSESYSRAYPNSSLKGVALGVEAHKTRAKPHVAAYIDAALSDRRNEVLLTRDKKRQVLGSIALNTKEKAPSRIAAIHQDNLMTGDHKPVRIEGEITLHAIFQALRPATALPSADEVEQLKPAHPVAPDDPPLTTAMERVG